MRVNTDDEAEQSVSVGDDAYKTAFHVEDLRPRADEFVLLNCSQCNRAGVDDVMGFADRNTSVCNPCGRRI